MIDMVYHTMPIKPDLLSDSSVLAAQWRPKKHRNINKLLLAKILRFPFSRSSSGAQIREL